MNTDCINWPGAKSSLGYGKIRWQGKTRLVTRVLFEQAYGEIAGNLFICHHCDNPSCINLSHLYAGTAKQNAQDMVRRGRISPWEKTKTHCPQGHPYDATNTYTHKGQRHCRTCVRNRARTYQANKRLRISGAA